MKPQTYFHIPTPCHENWDSMTPEGKGRFCASCAKQVVDFSLMTDQQVLNHFKQSTGKVCGRFANDQLQRPMVAAADQKKKVWWVAALMPLLLLFGKVNAQKKKVITKGEPALIVKDTMPELMGTVASQIRADIPKVSEEVLVNGKCWGIQGDTVLTKLSNKLIIKGHLTDDQNQPLPSASVFIKYSKLGMATDASGDFAMETEYKNGLPTIILSYVGYQEKEINLSAYADDITFVTHNNEIVREINLKQQLLTMQPASTGEVIFVGYTICRKAKPKDTLKTTVTKILKREAFKIYPNPVQSGTVVKLEIKKAGTYSIQVLDNSSKLILVNDFIATTDKSTTEFTIPVSALPGIYYIHLINETTKKQYTDKFIVQ